MAEPEELVIEGAHVATRVARDLWRRYGPPPAAPGTSLALVKTRLELFVVALLQRPMAIAPLDAPAPPTWLAMLATGRAHRKLEAGVCGTDGERIYLARSLAPHPSGEDTLALYRLLAVQQAVRIVRGTAGAAANLPHDHTRDWFALAEAVAVDAWIAEHAAGLSSVLHAARREALARRRKAQPNVTAGHAFEEHVRAFLANGNTPAFCRAATVEDSLVWARSAAGAHANPPVRGARAYPFYWGELVAPATLPVSRWRDDERDDEAGDRSRLPRVAQLRRRPRVRIAAEEEDDPNSGPWMIRADEPQESVEDPFGLQRPADRADDADPEGLADSLSELPEARVVRTAGRSREILQTDESFGRVAVSAPHAVARPAAIAYPEWDYRTERFRTPGAIVHERPPAPGDAEWVSGALERHGRLVRRVRTRFERLRPLPTRLFRQVDGEEIDLQSYVTAVADRCAGVTPDGRVFIARRPGRRELAVALLVDVSASTDAWVSAGQRIVDVEKEAMLLVCEALEALGDRYALFAFSGEGPGQVDVLALKRFDEPASFAVRRRIAALDSDRYTRLGAPIRHVTAALCREAAATRLLLLLTDGKPNDVDFYEGQYGIEDTRQAVAEARRQGVNVFCLTVDRDAPAYARRVFGRTGFAILRQPEQLPSVVVEILRHLIRV